MTLAVLVHEALRFAAVDVRIADVGRNALAPWVAFVRDAYRVLAARN